MFACVARGLLGKFVHTFTRCLLRQWWKSVKLVYILSRSHNLSNFALCVGGNAGRNFVMVLSNRRTHTHTRLDLASAAIYFEFSKNRCPSVQIIEKRGRGSDLAKVYYLDIVGIPQ